MAAAVDERPDSLDGWVSVRSGLFTEPQRPRLRFLVAWNEVEGKFAITCHSRPLQARSAEAEPPPPSSWAALYSPRELHGINRLLAASSPALERCFPALPELRPRGLWGLLFPDRSLAEGTEPGSDLDSVCRQLEVYLDAAVELCGHRIALDSLFPEAEDNDYFESVSELRGRSLEQQVAGGREALRQILRQHRHVKNMVTLKKLYQEEDEAYQDLVTAATQFYQCLLQPFRDMREFASLCRQEALKSLEFDTLGPRRIQSLQKEVEEWSQRMQEAICSIQDITVDYFRETVKALAAMQKQMEEDRNHFGKAAWASVAPRLEKLKFMFAKETLQHTRAKELCLKRKKAQIQYKMEHLDDKKAVEMVDELEMQYYETQLELYNIQLETLKYEELLVVAQLDTIRREVREKEEEVVYYDACEDPEQLQANEGMGLLHDSRSVDVNKLLHKAHQLETKRGAIGSRRSYLRNKRDQCNETQKAKQQQLQGEEARFRQHHSIQLKRDQQKEENKRRREWVNVERQKTLQRLRRFKEKSSGQIVFKPRCQTLRMQRQDTALPHSDQPMSIIEHSTSKKQSRPSKASSNIPVQIFLPAATPISPGLVETTEISSVMPPVPPPPPPPPPPLPPALLSSKRSSEGVQEQPLVFTTENSAKKSLKENIGTMDDVLASLKRGEVLLRKVDRTKVQSAEKPEGLRESLLAEIRRGVPLRKVQQPLDGKLNNDLPTDNDPASQLERSIKAAMKRMKKVSPDSDDEEEDGEWDS
ncbi:WASP homolog-associated protein with actin, membranes and microtubules [Pristis pectinata]|uniref:WASP homolog-associated protein with actin, membranes and microtubules n=1 Tax=Pristis pectinata TaxID=685728 RepID=UPI00223C9F39|nr:WASP homolog-associated protein with actin, membranes and microtubules [Pristis pectinata]